MKKLSDSDKELILNCFRNDPKMSIQDCIKETGKKVDKSTVHKWLKEANFIYHSDSKSWIFSLENERIEVNSKNKNNQKILMNTDKTPDLLELQNKINDLEILLNDQIENFNKQLNEIKEKIETTNKIQIQIPDEFYQKSVARELEKNPNFQVQNRVFSLRIAEHLINSFDEYCEIFSKGKGKLIEELIAKYLYEQDFYS